ncbi:nitrate/nitrite two-component system sensor histidine kinase NarQ [Vibrio sp. SS-MA-C1-2]|uniref:nitrate/nitrite two-component system sensor histidine kinase NarQ n=1 Tax=Vibrio sp. SS-MA-C1-2 TaxID=2908646 RepID=UPI001F27C8D5|nr:nitrate/nitrite two-component system sensor histidine kinase NarQ [Vibrio sp. SS-MA-C1-2]UJF17181.1 nitrate/nitrite two-component system sensor histidine kinase NarQ [Vibrio sp. SS-MA-C1-2]
MKKTMHSVTAKIASSLLAILLLAVVTTSFSFISFALILDDGKVINVSGSMRMQSYRLGLELTQNPDKINQHIRHFEDSLYSPAMKGLNEWWVPDHVKNEYNAIIVKWKKLKPQIDINQPNPFINQVPHFVNQIDTFVNSLERYSVTTLNQLAYLGSLGLGSILFISIYIIYLLRRRIIAPLKELMLASEQIHNRNFSIRLNENELSELGVLNGTFNKMASELERVYKGLELTVHKKNQSLREANELINTLYRSSQALSSTKVGKVEFELVLSYLQELTWLQGIELEINDREGQTRHFLSGKLDEENIKVIPLEVEGNLHGHLYWQPVDDLTDQQREFMTNIRDIFTKSIYFIHVQKQSDHVLIMEERATIARELHDSLAQSLSYLKIQSSILKRTMSMEPSEKVAKQRDTCMEELATGLNTAYAQLRELITTFRLSLKEGNFSDALTEVVTLLQKQSQAIITLNNQINTIDLSSNQQVHLIQLIREAVINAIKHAKPNHISINCNENDDTIMVTIEDNGIGFDQNILKDGHFGLSIMKERASRLDSHLTIQSSVGNGSKVSVSFKK